MFTLDKHVEARGQTDLSEPPVKSLDDPCGGLHHIELKFALGRAVETILSSSVIIVFGRGERSNMLLSASPHKYCQTKTEAEIF